MGKMEKSSNPKDLGRKQKYVLTAAIYLGYMTLGIGVSINGTCLIDLALEANSTVGEISWIFTGAAAGGILGAFLVPLVAKKCVLLVPIGIAVLMNGIVYVILPWCPYYELMVGAMVFFGIGKCFIDGSFTFTLVDTWRLENAPWMQGLHFMYGIGSMVAPLIAKPFIKAGVQDPDSTTNMTLSFNTNFTSGGLEGNHYKTVLDEERKISIGDPPLQVQQDATLIQTNAWSHGNSSILAAGLNNTQLISTNSSQDSTLYYAYLITAGLFFVSASVFITVGVVYRFIWGIKSRHHKNNRCSVNDNAFVPQMYKTLIIGSLFFYSFAGLLIEHSIVLFLFTFAVKEVHWTKDAAVLLMFLYWLSYTSSRGFCALIACCLQPKYILTTSIFIVTASSTILWICYKFHPGVLWACSIGLGVGIGPFFAPAVTFFNDYHPITPFVGGLTQLASAIAALIAPSISGLFYEYIGPVSLVYMIFTGSVMLVVFFISLVFSGNKIKNFKLDQDSPEAQVVDLREKA